MGEVTGEAHGFRLWPAATTGDLIIERPDGSRVVTQFGNGLAQLEYEVEMAKTKFQHATP